jgi:glycerol kinase
MTAVVAIDAGTTGVRSRAVFADGRPPVASYREFTQYFPKPGLVEHDADEIWMAVLATLQDVVAGLGAPPVAIGITNQRETIVAWDRTTGRPHGRAIVWQDRRTADRCDELRPALPLVRERTGLVLDPYFSASKVEWMFREGGLARSPSLAIGTVDSWLAWNLTGGASFVTDPSNASRTMLYDIVRHEWSDDLCDLFSVPRGALPDVRPSSGRIGVTADLPGVGAGIPVSGIAGDQQAALFGQACVATGSTKNTYGTGSFVLMNVGASCPGPVDGMLTTVAWDLGDGSPVYALEGAVFVTGAAIQWLRDGLGIISHAAEIGPLAASVPDSGGVVVVPAFTGLGSPWWDPRARGTILGITRGTTRAHLARAVVESIALQVRDVVEAMQAASGAPLRDLRVDGGAAAMDLLLQLQADHLGVDVLRPSELETTAMGAAFLAGLAEGVWPSLEDVAAAWRLERRFTPAPTGSEGAEHLRWREAVSRSRGWASEGDPT